MKIEDVTCPRGDENDEMMKEWLPTAKTRMLCNTKQDMKFMKNKSW